MFGIPSWAIGVVAICGGLGLMVVLIQLGEGLKNGLSGLKRQSRGPHTVIGMNVGVASGETTAQPEVLEDLQRRVAELEERLDFAERLLAQRPDPEKLMPPR
jgi:hypothetical protein